MGKLEENKLLIRKYINEVFNTGNVEDIEEYVSEDYTEVFEGKHYPIGIQGAKDHVAGVRRTYSDFKISIVHQIAEGDWVATSISVTGKHVGEWMGIKPTNKKVTFTGVDINRIIDGKIVEHQGAAYMLGQLLEIGAIKIVD